MNLLTTPQELKTSQIFKGLIYGQPGVGKSTLALSAPNPVCIDFDKGMKRVEPQFQTPSLQVETYQEVLDLLNSDEIESFETIVIDTLGKLIDRIGDYVAAENPKFRQGNGTMTMQGWGAIKGHFLNLLKLLESKNKSIIFVAHESEEKSDDKTIKRPDCSGSARKDIVKELDFMGYMEMAGNKRTISFSPSDKFYAKNSLGLNEYIEIPNTAKGNVFISEKIVRLTVQRLQEQSDLRVQYDELKQLINSNISELKTVEEVNNYYQEMGKKDPIWDSVFYEKKLLADRIKELDIEFNKESKEFESIKEVKASEEHDPEVKKEEMLYQEIKKSIEDCGSVEELEGLLEGDDTKRDVNWLRQLQNDSYILLMECVEDMKNLLDPEDNIVEGVC